MTVYVSGIDIGGTKTVGVLADERGRIVARKLVPTSERGSRIVDQVDTLFSDLIAEAGVCREAVARTVVGIAGVAGPDGSVRHAPNLQPLEVAEDLELGSLLADRLGHQVRIENDVNLAALAELANGASMPSSSFVFIAVGTGIGMGIVVDGALITGAHGAAGEIGLLPFGTDPLDTTNHHRGALEEATAGSTVGDRYRALTGTSRSMGEVLELALRGDEAAALVLDGQAKHTAQAIAAVVAVLDPACVVLGGGIGLLSELLGPIKTWLGRFGFPRVDIRLSRAGRDAAAIGAVRLALQQLDRSRQTESALA
ncbi:ROK family protein [Diaminobutyricibacter tongyongensis]|uniref:ROK family protein n=1 Tax=Leifsonia tongyongensis TaxID=1268043 RepID=A0A6L9XWJ3_9MICO|nr:ROK family protein [Diaminobutyricibacter tongyongensis]